MAYNPYGGNPYGAPPAFNSFPGALAPGLAPPPGLGAPPGMSAAAPGMAPPPGVQHANFAAAQANRPSGLSGAFQPPPNIPNINFNAPVIRLGSTNNASLPPKPTSSSATPVGGMNDPFAEGPGHVSDTRNRPGLGHERGIEQTRAALRESMQALNPPTAEERVRTIFLRNLPRELGGEEQVERFLSLAGRLRRWDAAKSQASDGKGATFGFAQYEDPESLAVAIEALKTVELSFEKEPQVKKEEEEKEAPKEEDVENLDAKDKKAEPVTSTTKLEVGVDDSTVKYLESYEDSRGDDKDRVARVEAARSALEQAIRDLRHPQAARTGENDTAMANGGPSTDDVEVVNIPIAQGEDELADIPAEMREIVAKEIASFRDRSIQRDMERLKREEEMEESERQRNGISRPRAGSPTTGHSANSIPVGPRGMPNAPSGPRGQNTRGVAFVNGTNGDHSRREDEDTDASDEELVRRETAKQKAEEDKLYNEAERKWVNRERQRAAALDREQDREKTEADGNERRVAEQREREKTWDDEKESSRKTHLYYRDHGAWIRQRVRERADEESRDELDRRAETDERRRQAAEMEQARDMADSFLDRQLEEMESRDRDTATAPARFTMSLGAAAQKAQAGKGNRRTMAEVEGLLDDEDKEDTSKRQLIPIKFDPVGDTKTMSEEEVQQAVRSLAQEIPTTKEGLWAWDVKWEFLDDSVITEKLRPFVEKKVVEYLGVQEQLLVEVVEDLLRKHSKPSDMVTELEGPLEDDAEDLVKKLWRMVIFFAESEKRGLLA